MPTTDQFLLAANAYQEIQAELRQEKRTLGVSSEISNPEIISPQPAGLPGGSLMLGIAEDGSPVLFDLYDPAPGPLLVAGDGGSGKTTLLQALAFASDLQNPGDIQFGVITPFPEEWTFLEGLSTCLGVWPAYHPSSQAFLTQLVNWTESFSRTRQAVLLLFDGFDLLTGNAFHVQHNLRWLLMYGPEHHIWPVVTINPARLTRFRAWLDLFRTRFIGQVKNSHNARLLVDDPELDLTDLIPGEQFGLLRPNSWLKFRLLSTSYGDKHEHWNALV